MNEFKNSTILSIKDIREVNRHLYLKTPLYLVLYAVCILSIISRLIDYFVYNVVNLSATIPFLLALVAMFIVFVTNSKNMYKETLGENGNPIEYNYSLENGVITLHTSSGDEKSLPLNEIYKSFETKNCFTMRCRDGSFFIIKKNGFTLGTAEDFKKVLKG
ncbi:MAG: YcxB family protein [Clostridia bacterium]|nr:YcxB family protein [Clostridia bacterium]MBQ4131747.1 YcxB family protein [Clostridia bacterium]